MPTPTTTRAGAALITGGSGAIGSAVTRQLARDGVTVVFTYRSDAETAEKLAHELTAEGARVEARRLDVTDEAAAAELVQYVEDTYGSLHSLIYASGPFVEFNYLSRITPRQFADQLTADTVGFFNILHPAIARLRKTGGSVVAVATAAMQRAIIRDGLSAGPKGAVEGIIRTLALEEGRFGVRANCVGVGMTTIGMAADLIEQGAFGDAGLAEATANIPMRRFGTAEEVADAVCFLASDRASFISGQTLNVDGGYTA